MNENIVQNRNICRYVFVLMTLFCSVIHVSSFYCQNDEPDWPEYLGDEQDCPLPGDRFITFYNTLHVPWGIEGRAWYTLPPEIEIKNSTIPGIGLGAYTKIFIPSHTWLSEYEGEVINDDDVETISPYAWRIYHNEEITHFIDGGHVDTSNWLRWINCARTRSEENVQGLYCKGRVFYYLYKDVYPGQELLVYYGHDYANKLGIDTSGFS